MHGRAGFLEISGGLYTGVDGRLPHKMPERGRHSAAKGWGVVFQVHRTKFPIISHPRLLKVGAKMDFNLYIYIYVALFWAQRVP